MFLRLFLLLYTIQYSYCSNLSRSFDKINNITVTFNSIAAEISWELCMNPSNPELPEKAADYERKRITWQSATCNKLVKFKSNALLSTTQRRMIYLLCRGPKFTFTEAREMSKIYRNLQSMYDNVQICIPSANITQRSILDKEYAITNFINAVKRVSNTEMIISDSVLFAAKIAANSHFGNSFLCLKGESDFDKLMSHSTKEDVLRWLWLVWREKVKPTIKRDYKKLVSIENIAARRNGYSNIGAVWRDELETPLLRQLCLHLYSEIKPLYELLHGVVRFYLRKYYGNIVTQYGPIPAHLLGDLWSQDWEPLINLITSQNIDLDSSIQRMNWTVKHMVRRADDFYMSMGLPPMPPKFWQHSVFTRMTPETRCHGAAANMFQKGDYRLIYCSDTSMEDFYVIHHEMGHIHYYMAYENQPGLFRQGANTAFHESIGDTIMIGVMTPQHLHRLGLINDTTFYATYARRDRKEPCCKKNPTNSNKNKNTASTKYRTYYKNSILDDDNIDAFQMNYPETKYGDDDGIRYIELGYKGEINVESDISVFEILLLKQALKKIPNIPFSLLLDEYRWRYFEGSISELELNREFWRLSLELQGIMPASERGEEYFDVAAKFHVPDNTPYIRYFLSSFLQYQLYEGLCKTAVFGRRNFKDSLPDSILLSRCDIYGSKATGKMLKDLMARGGSKNWRETLFEVTGQYGISASSIKQYFEPLQKLLWRLVNTYNIPIGW